MQLVIFLIPALACPSKTAISYELVEIEVIFNIPVKFEFNIVVVLT